MTRCCIKGCSNTHDKEKKISLFRFPRDLVRSAKWVEILKNSGHTSFQGRSVDELHRNCRLCSDHFEHCMFMNPNDRKSLLRTAIPTLRFNIPKPVKRLKHSRKTNVRNKNQQESVSVKRLKIKKIVTCEPDLNKPEKLNHHLLAIEVPAQNISKSTKGATLHTKKSTRNKINLESVDLLTKDFEPIDLDAHNISKSTKAPTLRTKKSARNSVSVKRLKLEKDVACEPDLSEPQNLNHHLLATNVPAQNISKSTKAATLDTKKSTRNKIQLESVDSLTKDFEPIDLDAVSGTCKSNSATPGNYYSLVNIIRHQAITITRLRRKLHILQKKKMNRRYFIAKCHNIPSLKQCIETGVWACRDHSVPPHPRHILTDALLNNEVIIIFSVNNCHGYHGYCKMLDKPGSYTPKEGDTSSKKVENNQSNETSETEENSVWFQFHVEWETCFLKQFGEQCLPFSSTDHFVIADQNPLNKCRNWQEIDSKLGECLCQLIDTYHQQLCAKREAVLMKKQESQASPFIQLSASNSMESVKENWLKTVQKVESELGKVIIACPFGSQRYNLQTKQSDTDMFIVYAAETKQLLGFDPPKQTIKSNAAEECDYTIHELYRFCELLSGGDPRCIESLFLHESSEICSADCWKELKAMRSIFLTRECLDKYLRDAQGSNGIKLLRKWTESLKDKDKIPNKIYKLVYIIVRLLQNALDIIKREELRVFREDGSEEKEMLMKIRSKQVTVDEMWKIIEKLETEVNNGRDMVPQCSDEVVNSLEAWLLKLRFDNFTKRPP